MNKTFEQMNKTELEKAIGFFKLKNELRKEAKNPEKPTNVEYVRVLELFKAKQDKVNFEVAKEIKEEVVTGSTKIDSPVTKAAKRQNMSDDLTTSVPVIVTDHDTSLIIEDDNELRIIEISWGNPVIGMFTTRIPLHGQMQYLPKGAIIRLKAIPMAVHTNDENGKSISHRNLKRFSIADTTGWTPEQFNSHKEEQKLKRI